LLTSGLSENKVVKIVKLSSLIPTCPFKEILKNSKFFGKEKKKVTVNKALQNKLYAQVAGLSILEILKLKEKLPQFAG